MTVERSSQLVPLAVTLAGDGSACVAGLDREGRWIRPEPVAPREVTGPRPVFRFFLPVTLPLGPSTSPDPRPEDRARLTSEVVAHPPVTGGQRTALLEAHLDRDPDAAFRGDRSAGLVRARPLRLYHRRASSGAVYLRMEFADDGGAVHDWIVRDVDLLRAHPAPADGPPAASAAVPFTGGSCYLAIALTRPNGRAGGYRGCQPLVVGVHQPTDGADASSPAAPATKGATDAHHTA